MWRPDVPEVLILLGLVGCVAWAIYNRIHYREGIRK
jgi:hypothetical protein